MNHLINDKYKEDFSDHPSILKILENTTKSDSEMFSFEPVKENYVHKIISKLNVRKATGADTISAKILKSCAQSISSPISNLVNTAFKKCQFPAGMKIAQVLPLHKKKRLFK